jgi:hypothetical protein
LCFGWLSALCGALHKADDLTVVMVAVNAWMSAFATVGLRWRNGRDVSGTGRWRQKRIERQR